MNEVTKSALEGQQPASGRTVAVPSDVRRQSTASPAENYHNDDTALPEVETRRASSNEIAEPRLEKRQPPDTTSASGEVVAPTDRDEDQFEGLTVLQSAMIYRLKASNR